MLLRKLAGAVLCLLCPVSVVGNWLLQCSSCVDQAFFGDQTLKTNVQDADTSVLLTQIKQLRLREFEHREDEFYNKFFSKRQLGIVTQEAQTVMPGAVAMLPERRWTNAKGVSNTTKNVMMLRNSHILFSSVGALQVLAKRAEHWDSMIEQLDKEMRDVVVEQSDNRRKREEMLEQIVQTITRVEVMHHTLRSAEEGFIKLDADVEQLKARHEETAITLQRQLWEVSNTTDAQTAEIDRFEAEFTSAVDRESRADLVEKRKSAEADLEVTLVKRSIEKLHWEEEQNTIQLRADEQRKSDEHTTKLHQERVAHELEQKKVADLELLQSQEESNMRQEAAKQAGEMELLKLRLESDEKRAEIGMQQAIETAKVEQEAKIKERRLNEDVNLRALRAEQEEKRRQTLDAIKATAEIAFNWVSSLYSSPRNLFLAIGSIVAAIAGAYLAREMAILLREQLNKRLGRPSLVRMTNRRGTLKAYGIALLRMLRLRAPHGSEFSDVVLHPRLKEHVMRLADATGSAKKRRMPLQHVMFYGPPGTGKTMVAQRFAEYSGLEYAIMSGGDVAPLEEQAVTELHKLFKWVHRSSKGVLLFIDEADAFLTSRTGGNMSESLRNALTTMLYHTGTPSSQFMLVLATNRPGDLDSAVLDRIDESVEFGLPDLDAREGMVKLYYESYVARPLGIGKLTPTKAGKGSPSANGVTRRVTPAGLTVVAEKCADEPIDMAALAEAARCLDGFSGREIAKLFTSFQTHVLYTLKDIGTKGSRRSTIPRSLLFEVIQQKVLEHKRTADFLVSGYMYKHDEKSGSKCGTPSNRATPSNKHNILFAQKQAEQLTKEVNGARVPGTPKALPPVQAQGTECRKPAPLDIRDDHAHPTTNANCQTEEKAPSDKAASDVILPDMVKFGKSDKL